MGVWYCTREDVKSALDSKETARNNAQIDRAIEASSRSVEGLCHRIFYPWYGTKYFDWPNADRSFSWRLWLHENELLLLESIISGNTIVPPSDYFLEPSSSGPPYSHVDINTATSSSWSSGDSSQRSIALTGVFSGAPEDLVPAATLNSGDLNAFATTISNTNGALVGVGSLLKIEDEYLEVTARANVTSSQSTQASLDAKQSSVTVAVTNGAAFATGEIIYVDSERMLVVDIVGNNLVVKRAWDGSVLAAHNTSSAVYVSRSYTVTRGALGTEAGFHLNGTAISAYNPPGLVRSLTVADAVSQLQNEQAGFAASTSTGNGSRRTGNASVVDDVRTRCYARHGRKARTGSV